MNDAATEQPSPIPGQQPVLPTVIRCMEMADCREIIPDLESRARMGYQRYGTYLMTHNGRDALMDCYQELLDGLMYVHQAMMERNEEGVHRLSRIRMYITVAAEWAKKELENRS
jgi:hypothetical protein